MQAAAVVLMIWARIAFATRCFHATANPTAGGLVTSGPYRYIRHPIYASICLFVWAGVMGNLSLFAVSLGGLATGGAVLRLRREEHLLSQAYPEYGNYSRGTSRLLAGVW